MKTIVHTASAYASGLGKPTALLARLRFTDGLASCDSQNGGTVMQTSRYCVELHEDSPHYFGEDNNADGYAVLHGELYDAGGTSGRKREKGSGTNCRNGPKGAAHNWFPTPFRGTAQLYAEQGDRFFERLNGSFAALVVDRRQDRVLLATDRINSRRLFCSQQKDGFYVTSRLEDQPLGAFSTDATAVAWYLSNGVVHNRRTPYEGVSVLERACVHELTRQGLIAKPYWQYDFQQAAESADEAALEVELRERLVASVERRLQDHPDVFLSLSGGYDAAGILGILAHTLQVTDVRCFSYVHGDPPADSDAQLSRQAAKLVGYKHKFVESYRGDLVSHIRDNAAWGLGYANCCDELNAWQAMAAEFSSVQRPVVFVGDECLGWNDCTIQSMAQLLASVSLASFQLLDWLAPKLPKATAAEFRDGVESDIQAILNRLPPTDDPHDSKDLLYLEERLANHILPWRENFAGRFATARSPLLDNELLDFMKQVPSSLRRGKRLYRRTIRNMFPELFELPRARRGYYTFDLQQEFARHRDACRRLVIDQDSKLDELIPPDLVLELIDEVANGRTNRACRGASGRQFVRKVVAGRFHRYIPGLNSKSKKRAKLAVEPATLLRRLLVLRTAMEI